MSDEYDDDRPRRGRRDDDDYEDDDRPRRSRRSDNSDPPAAVTVLGVLSLVIGLLSLLGSFIPCVGMFAIITASIALIMGVIGIAIAKQANSGGLALPVTGTVLSSLAILIAIAWFVVISVFMKGVEDVGKKLEEESRQNAQQQKNEIAAQPGMPVTAIELYGAYDANSARADTKYRRQIVEVTGTIIRVNDRAFQVVVELVGNEKDQEKAIECEFAPEARAALIALVPDQQVTIRGRCTGKIGRRVFVADAILIK